MVGNGLGNMGLAEFMEDIRQTNMYEEMKLSQETKGGKGDRGCQNL